MIEKRYKDIDAGWFRLGQEAAVCQLSRLPDNIEFVLAKLYAGITVQTTHALYRWVPDEEEAEDE